MTPWHAYCRRNTPPHSHCMVPPHVVTDTNPGACLRHGPWRCCLGQVEQVLPLQMLGRATSIKCSTSSRMAANPARAPTAEGSWRMCRRH